MVPPNRIYFYKLTTGGAPCVQNGLLSLAICKPIIRSTAEKNDIIFGFAANSLHADNRLIYLARVTEKLCHGCYYNDTRYAQRRDCVYRYNKAGRFEWKCAEPAAGTPCGERQAAFWKQMPSESFRRVDDDDGKAVAHILRRQSFDHSQRPTVAEPVRSVERGWSAAFYPRTRTRSTRQSLSPAGHARKSARAAR